MEEEQECLSLVPVAPNKPFADAEGQRSSSENGLGI